MTATLLSQTGKITRQELQTVPVPQGTSTHQPLSHYEIVEALLETLGFRRIEVVRDEYAVSHDGMRMFGVLDLELGITGVRFSIGIRNANDKSMRLAMCIGFRVLVCAQHGVPRRLHAGPRQTLEELQPGRCCLNRRRPDAAQFRAARPAHRAGPANAAHG